MLNFLIITLGAIMAGWVIFVFGWLFLGWIRALVYPITCFWLEFDCGEPGSELAFYGPTTWIISMPILFVILLFIRSLRNG